MLGIELPDYMSCVHLHQEVISALLVETPGERKNALDRLMGLAPLRNLLDGIHGSRISEQLRDIDNQFGGIETQLEAGMQVKRSDLERATKDAGEHGIVQDELSLGGGKKHIGAIKDQIQKFAGDYGLPAPDLPECKDLEDMESFIDAATAAVRKLRNEQPDMAHQQHMLRRKKELGTLKVNYEGKKETLQDLRTKTEKLTNSYGDLPELKDRLKKVEKGLLPEARNRQNEISNRAGVIREALKLLGSPQGKSINRCPVCEQTISPEDVRRHLEKWQEEMKDKLASTEAEIKKLEEEETNLKKVISQLRQLQSQTQIAAKDVSESTKAIADALKVEISESQDPLTLLSKGMADLEDELEKVGKVVEQSNARLNSMEDGLADVRRINTILRIQRDMEELSKIKETNEYEQVAKARKSAHDFADLSESIYEAVQTVLQRNAKSRIASTRDAISSIFRELAQRSDFPDLRIDPVSYEVIAVRGDKSEIAQRFLNKGDINCAALSIFLALATSKDLSHNLGFMILDDPSQTLDSTHNERLAGVLDHVLGNRQLIIATSEENFAKELRNSLTKKKQVYFMRDWSDDTGPKVEIE
ncbi:hypothetical protein CH330_05690 [candidate division WOR-3 bacterium JGI_Cruoil_03_51_56]|uniref:Zinc-hook domain-containing protein n=1 Tax=candidate division WOR-3 bacterium JGI_Cruoil_03_51_56 TaxID=1973747 RepID=A0A235BV43_UNCW3|nr:MAG: hypothetical protein CH330_05690 [candidate division WOR-3 bacterium JGI_Cruoil_03_51_56]